MNVYVFFFFLAIRVSANFFTPATLIGLAECGKNERRVHCGYNCEPQCGFQPTICSLECIPNACVCKDGFVRNTNNECVHRLDCTAETSMCPEDEEFRTCASVCQPSCEDPTPSSCDYDGCVRNVCRCQKGLVRNDGFCTPLSECPILVDKPLAIFTL